MPVAPAATPLPGTRPLARLWFDSGKFTSIYEVKLLVLSNGDSTLLSAKGMSQASSLEQDCTDKEMQLGSGGARASLWLMASLPPACFECELGQSAQHTPAAHTIVCLLAHLSERQELSVGGTGLLRFSGINTVCFFEQSVR